MFDALLRSNKLERSLLRMGILLVGTLSRVTPIGKTACLLVMSNVTSPCVKHSGESRSRSFGIRTLPVIYEVGAEKSGFKTESLIFQDGVSAGGRNMASMRRSITPWKIIGSRRFPVSRNNRPKRKPTIALPATPPAP